MDCIPNTEIGLDQCYKEVEVNIECPPASSSTWYSCMPLAAPLRLLGTGDSDYVLFSVLVCSDWKDTLLHT